MSKLALLGGKSVRKKKFPEYRTIDSKELKAVAKVLKSGTLSKYVGSWHKNFYGGKTVNALEKEWAAHVGAKHAVAVNSATSALYAACGSLGIGPGDEVIVPPYTMAASGTGVLLYNAVPIFADIEDDYFCIDPRSVEARITPRTKAIIAVDLFGHPYYADEINKIAGKHKLKVIEDAAQAPAALYKGRYAGTLGDIGIFSLNYHKHIHSGEGGIAVTNDDELAERMRLIRNHAEAVVGAKGETDLTNMLGFNFRMTEIEAAISREQLKKLDRLVSTRISNCKNIEKGLSGIEGIIPPKVQSGCKHVYYMHVFKFKEEAAGVSRDLFIKAVKAELKPTEHRENEGVLINCGYVKPLYLEPLYQKMVLYGGKQCPFKCSFYKKTVSYKKGICPTVERMHYKELFLHHLMHANMTRRDLDDFVNAFCKVWDNRKELRRI